MNTSTHAPARQVAAPPTVVALITCAGIHQDDTRKAYLLGVFNGYQAPTYPAQMPRLALYLSLTDGRGPTPLTVRLIDGADDDAPPLFAFELPPVRFGSPLDVKEVALEVPAVTLPRAGLYRWQVVCAGEVIHERRLVAQGAGG